MAGPKHRLFNVATCPACCHFQAWKMAEQKGEVDLIFGCLLGFFKRPSGIFQSFGFVTFVALRPDLFLIQCTLFSWISLPVVFSTVRIIVIISCHFNGPGAAQAGRRQGRQTHDSLR
jgi:hypothetical protein